jgi:hypothetical protein
VFLIIFLRREALEITIRAIKRTQIPISVLGATLPILSEIDKHPFEVTIENLPVDVNMRIRPKIPPEGEPSVGYLFGFLKFCPWGKRSLDCAVFMAFSSRIHKNKTILLGDVHFAIKLIGRAVINLRGPAKSNTSAYRHAQP